MKHGSTYFLRFVISLIGIGVLALCFALPTIWKGGTEEFSMIGYPLFFIIILVYATVVPFFFALVQAFKLLNYIDHSTAFSDLSVKALKNIRYAATIIAVFYIPIIPLLIPIAEADDAPGLILVGLFVACVPIVVGVFAAILERLLKNAIEIKSENDLTV